jgi:predicted RNA-binding Zn ribbon-like protein
MESKPQLSPGTCLLLAFANTYDFEDAIEALPNPEALDRWLVDQGLLDPTTQHAAATRRQLQLALTLRTGLRMAMASHHASEERQPDREFERACARLPLRVVFELDGPRLAPVDDGVQGALEQLLVAVAESCAEGSWSRLKICPTDDCLVAFYDNSRNRSREWCSMAVCGNRTKTRAYRQRVRADAAG